MDVRIGAWGATPALDRLRPDEEATSIISFLTDQYL